MYESNGTKDNPAAPNRLSNGLPELISSEDAPPKLERIPIAKLIRANPHFRQPLIDRLLREREIMNIVAAPKMYKSFLGGAIGISLAAGRPIFGSFVTYPGRVLLIDNELHAETIAGRIPQIAHALGIMPDDYYPNFDCTPMRGRLRDINRLRTYFNEIEPGEYKLIILDALYRFLPANAENDNSLMTEVYNLLDEYAELTRAAIIAIHHTSKGIQAAKGVTDVGSGAGAQSRAADTHLIIRQHEEDDGAVLDAVVRSWPPLPAHGIRWEYPIWRHDPFMDTSRLLMERGKGGRPRKLQTPLDEPVEPTPGPWTVDRFVSRFVTHRPKLRDAIMAEAMAAGLTDRGAKGWLASAETEGRAFRIGGTGGKPARYTTDSALFNGGKNATK